MALKNRHVEMLVEKEVERDEVVKNGCVYN